MVATEAIDRLQPTAASHDRVMILEVMGRDSGQIALASGIAGGADVSLCRKSLMTWYLSPRISPVAAARPQLRYRCGRRGVRDNTGEHVRLRHALGGATYGGIGHVLGEALGRMTGAETRVTVLGHVQRGGQPTWDDRLVASAFGVYAVDLIAEGRFDRMVAWQSRRVLDVPLTAAFETGRIRPPTGRWSEPLAAWASASVTNRGHGPLSSCHAQKSRNAGTRSKSPDAPDPDAPGCGRRLDD